MVDMYLFSGGVFIFEDFPKDGGVYMYFGGIYNLGEF